MSALSMNSSLRKGVFDAFLHSIVSNAAVGSFSDDCVAAFFPCVDRGMLEYELDLANPGMVDLARRFDVVTDVAAGTTVEDPPLLLLFTPRLWTGGRGELEIPDLEVHTLLPEGEVGRGGSGGGGVECVEVIDTALAFRDNADLGGGVWGEYLDVGEIGGGGGGIRLGVFKDGGTNEGIAGDDGSASPLPMPSSLAEDILDKSELKAHVSFPSEPQHLKMRSRLEHYLSGYEYYRKNWMGVMRKTEN